MFFLNSEAGEKGRVNWSGVKVCGYTFAVRISNNNNVLNLQEKKNKTKKLVESEPADTFCVVKEGVDPFKAQSKQK